MADDKKLDIPPGILKAVEFAVETAVSRKLEGMSIVNLKECQEKLEATQHALIDMQTNFELWQNLAKVHKDQNEKLRGEMVEMNAQIALLLSVVENKKAESGVTAGDDE